MVMEGELTLGGEYTLWYIDDVVQHCTPETCVTLLTIVMPLNFNFKKGYNPLKEIRKNNVKCPVLFWPCFSKSK